MKTILTAILLLSAMWAQATLTLGQSFGGGTILDGNPVGTTFSGTFNQAGAGDQILGVTVGLDISGGFNGDLYSYLVAPNGALVVLLNQPGSGVNGFGASGAGMNITLTDALTANGSIQGVTSGNVLSGNYNAAGSLSTFGSLSSPGGTANGVWTLFFADLSAGGGTSTLNGWTLNLTVVPEPVTWALIIFAGVLGLVVAIRQREWFKAQWCRFNVWMDAV